MKLPRESEVRSVAFSPDGRTVLTGNVAGAQLWNAATGEPIGPPLQHEGTITVAAFSPNRRHALSSEVTLRFPWPNRPVVATTREPFGRN